jgi:RNA polymerase sigma-70 factor (ECF subfamily)
MALATEGPEAMLERARRGDAGALGSLLEAYRNYIHLSARLMAGDKFVGRLSASDVVQETFLDACKDFPQFLGGSERELLVWLRRILANNIADHLRARTSQRRDVGRERSIDDLFDASEQSFDHGLAASGSSPSSQASRRERAVIVADALAKLQPDHRDVIVYRNFEHLPFEEVAQRMERTSAAVRMLWARAVEKLSEELERLQ